jgi:hypothetical protein
MSEEIRFEPVPEVSVLGSDHPTEVVEVVVRLCPPGTPARPRPNRPHLHRPDERRPSTPEGMPSSEN